MYNIIMKQIPEHPGYLATEDGMIWSDKTNRFLKQFISSGGYVRVTLRTNNKTKQHKVHRLIATTFLGSGVEVNHKDLNKQNNNVANLEWVNRSENVLHWYQARERVREL